MAVMEALLLETRTVYHKKIILDFYCLRETELILLGHEIYAAIFLGYGIFRFQNVGV